MKEHSAAGIGLIFKRAGVVTVDEENQMCESNILGEEVGKQLVETLVYLFGYNYRIPGHIGLGLGLVLGNESELMLGF